MAHTKVTKTHSQNTGAANTFSYSGSFDVFKGSEVVVLLDGIALTLQAGTIDESASPREYTVDTTAKTIHIGGADLSSGIITIRPETDLGNPTPRATYAPGASVTSDDLNNNQLQLMRKAMEYNEQKLASTGGTMTGDLHLGQNVNLTFEGSAEDDHETTLTVANPTSDKTITLPDTTGTVITTGDTGTVTSTMINDGTIVNDDVNASAAIAGTKISPDFGSQNIATTGTVNGVSTTELSILDGATVTTDELNILDGVTSTASELNILDGVTATTAELNILDGVTSTAAELNILDGVTSTAAELNLVDGITAGTVSASLAVIADSNKDISGFRNVTLTGELDAGSLDISGDADIDGTLEADAITVGGTALNTVIAGVTVTNATTAAVATTVTISDNESTDEDNLITFVEDATTSTGNVGLEMDGNFSYNPSTGTVTATIFKGNIDAVDGDFDGTLEADAITVNGTALNTVIADEATALAIALG